ncbi:hypothetical protein ACVWYH_000999 [Bradyrhizobium sp. GM24.11]
MCTMCAPDREQEFWYEAERELKSCDPSMTSDERTFIE